MAAGVTIRNILTRFGFTSDGAALGRIASNVDAVKARAAAASTTVGGLGASIKGMLVSYLGLGAIQGALGGLISANSQFGYLNARLETVTGSSEKAKKAMDWIAKFAAETPFELQQVGNAFAILSEKSLDTTDATMRALGDLAAGTGKADVSLETVAEGIGEAAMGQTMRLSRATGMDWSALGGKLVVMGLDKQKVSIEKNAEAIQKYLVTQGQLPLRAGMMAKMSKTLGGSLSNLKDSVWQVTVALGNAGLTGIIQRMALWLASAAGRIKAFVDDEDKMRKVSKVARKVALGLGVAVSLIAGRAALDGLGKLRLAINGVGKAGLLANLKLMLPVVAIGLLLLGIEDLIGFTQGEDSIFGRMLDANGIDPEPIKKSLRKIGVEAEKLWEKIKEGGKVILEALNIETPEGFAEAIAGIVVAVSETTATIITKFQEAGEAIGVAAAKTYLAWESATEDAADASGEAGMRSALESESWLDYVVRSARATWANITGIFSAGFSWIAAGWSWALGGTVWEDLKGAAWGAVVWVADIFLAAGQKIIDAFTWAWDTTAFVFWKVVGGLSDAVVGVFTGAIDLILAGVEKGINGIAEILNVLPDNLLDKMGIRDFANNGITIDRIGGSEPSASSNAVAPTRPAGFGAMPQFVPKGLATTPAFAAAGPGKGGGVRTLNAQRTNNISVTVPGVVTTDPVELANRIAVAVKVALAEEMASTLADYVELA